MQVRPDSPNGISMSAEAMALVGPRGQTILRDLLREWAAYFIEASQHYGDDNADVLGLAGQYADIWRKIGPLKRALWDGEKLARETPRKILMDLIGHCFLAIEMIDRQHEEVMNRVEPGRDL